MTYPGKTNTENDLIVMGDLPRLKNDLVVMGDLLKLKNAKNFQKWSHCNGDLPRWKNFKEF